VLIVVSNARLGELMVGFGSLVVTRMRSMNTIRTLR